MKASDRIGLFGIVFLFFWVSFIAPAFPGGFLFPLLLLAWLVLLLLVRRDLCRRIFAAAEIPFCVFMVTMAGGILAAGDRTLALSYFWRFVFPAPFIYFFAKCAFEREQFPTVIRVVCCMAVGMVALGIVECIAAYNPLYENLVFNLYYTAFRGKRMMSTQMHPAALGSYLVVAFSFAIMVIAGSRKGRPRAQGLFCAGSVLLGIFLTFSRGALLGIAAVGALWHKGKVTRKNLVFLSIIFLILAAVVLSCSVLSRTPDYRSFSRYSLKGLMLEGSTYGRKVERFLALGPILRDHPFIGLGFGHFRVHFDRYLPHATEGSGFDAKVADCMYVTVLSETGLIGFAGFLLFLCSLLVRAGRRPGTQEALAERCLCAAFVGIACTFITYDGLFWAAPAYLFWSVAGMLSALSS